jgi:hypothetical protein
MALLVANQGYADTTRHTIDSRALANNTVGMNPSRSILVYVPPGYETSTERYPTVYYLPGYASSTWGFPSATQTDLAIEDGRLPPAIIVVVNASTNVLGTMFLNSAVFGMWEDFILEEVIPLVDGEYRTIADPRRRALTGWSAGGYSAVLLPLRNPGVWGAIGTNDAAMQVACPNQRPRAATMQEAIDVGVAANDLFALITLQMGTTISPNPDSPMQFDITRDWDARETIPEVRAMWDEYCFQHEASVDRWRDAILEQHMMAITVGASNVTSNGDMISLLEGVGANVKSIPIEGGHGDDTVGRTLMLAQETLDALLAVSMGTAVEARGKAAATWGELKGRAATGRM